MDRGISNGGTPIVILWINLHFRRDRFGFHRKGPFICRGAVVGHGTFRPDRDGPNVFDGKHTRGPIDRDPRRNTGARLRLLQTPGAPSVSGAALGLQGFNHIAVIDVAGFSGNFQRVLGRQGDFHMGFSGKLIISAVCGVFACDGRRIAAGGGQNPVRTPVVIFPDKCILIFINHEFIIHDCDNRFFLRAVVGEGGLRQFNDRGNRLAQDFHAGDFGRVRWSL